MLKLQFDWYIRNRVQIFFFPRTARDWNQLLPDMSDIMSLVEFQNYVP